MRFDNDNSFNRGTDEKPRTIRGTIRLGSKIDIQKLVTMCQTDLTLESSIKFYYKDLQAWETVQTTALVCGDNKIPAEQCTLTFGVEVPHHDGSVFRWNFIVAADQRYGLHRLPCL